jgi:hypothetical protein
MSSLVVIRDEFFEGQDIEPIARVVGLDGEVVVQADISSIALEVYDEDSDTPTTSVLSAVPVVASTIFDTLQVDSRWGEDDIGYNFRYAILASALTAVGGHTYRCEFLLTPSSGGPIPVVGFFKCIPLRST